MKVLQVTGAYGQATSMLDWHKGRDFKIINGPYMSNRDILRVKQDGYDAIEFVNHFGHVVNTIHLTQGVKP